MFKNGSRIKNLKLHASEMYNRMAVSLSFKGINCQLSKDKSAEFYD